MRQSRDACPPRTAGSRQPARLPSRFAVSCDCSHASSAKDPQRRPTVARAVGATRRTQPAVRALMLESHLVGGRRDIGPDLVYGQRVTDACLGFEETAALVRELAAG